MNIEVLSKFINAPFIGIAGSFNAVEKTVVPDDGVVVFSEKTTSKLILLSALIVAMYCAVIINLTSDLPLFILLMSNVLLLLCCWLLTLRLIRKRKIAVDSEQLTLHFGFLGRKQIIIDKNRLDQAFYETKKIGTYPKTTPNFLLYLVMTANGDCQKFCVMVSPDIEVLNDFIDTIKINEISELWKDS